MTRSRGRPGPRGRSSPYRLFTLIALLSGGTIAVLLRLQFGVNWPLAYLAGVNLATLLLYAYDKSAAARGGGRTRVPERVLHGAAFLGGTPAALLAQAVLRHKTVKRSFRASFLVICVVQLLALAAWAYWRYAVQA
jgi:uncharacterized membrane protein YsdA (DUF1294 family)